MNVLEDPSGDHQALVEQLRRHPLFDGLSPDDTAAVVNVFTIHGIEAGEAFIEQGGPSDALFVVLSGRCRVVLDGREKDQVGRGAVFGELGLLAAAPRSASVLAIRECVVARMSSEALQQITQQVPLFWRSLGMSAGRLASGKPHGEERGSGARVLAVISLDGRPLDTVARQMAAELARFGPCALLTDADARSLDRAERDHDFVVVHTGDVRWRARQADQLVVVVDGTSAARSLGLPPHTGSLHLWLVQPSDVQKASGTGAWLDRCEPKSHHHVRAGVPADAERATRLLVGRGSGLSLAGGAARGIAHLGLVRAMGELSMHSDHYTGASAGGALAAMLAVGWDEAACTEGFNRLLTCTTPSPGRMTFPIVGLMSGRAPVDVLQALFGELYIEDVLVPLDVPATDLESGARYVFDRGPLWRAVRATGSLPLFWPPLVYQGRWLADAGLVSNQPVDLLVPTCGAGLLIASDLGTPKPSIPRDGQDWLSGWKALAQYWRGEPIPGLANTLVRAMTLTDAAELAYLDELGRQHPLLHLQLPVADLGFFGRGGQQEAITRAAAFASEALGAVVASASREEKPPTPPVGAGRHGTST